MLVDMGPGLVDMGPGRHCTGVPCSKRGHNIPVHNFSSGAVHVKDSIPFRSARKYEEYHARPHAKVFDPLGEANR
jgi:hypothetical protein